MLSQFLSPQFFYDSCILYAHSHTSTYIHHTHRSQQLWDTLNCKTKATDLVNRKHTNIYTSICIYMPMHFCVLACLFAPTSPNICFFSDVWDKMCGISIGETTASPANSHFWIASKSVNKIQQLHIRVFSWDIQKCIVFFKNFTCWWN